MAEVFATVASGAGLASLGLQLLECAVKLKRFYESCEKAPKVLNRLSRDINTFALLLRQIDDTRALYSVEDTEVLQESIEICRDCTQDIITLTSQLEATLRRHNITGRIYTVLRMREVTELCAELEGAKTSLMMAFQLFDHRTRVRIMGASQNLAIQQSLILLNHGETIAHIREDTSVLLGDPKWNRSRPALMNGNHNSARATLLSQEPHKDDRVADERSITPSIEKHHRRPYRFRLPYWFPERIWELSTSRSFGRWDVCLKTYNQRPVYSLVVKHYLSGSVDAIQGMFTRGQASPNDVYGAVTPLELAILSGSTEMLHFLLQHAVIDSGEVLDRALSFWTSVWFDIVNELPHNKRIGNRHPDLCKRLLAIFESLMRDRRMMVDDSYDVADRNSHFWSCPSEALVLYNSQLVKPIKRLTAKERFDLLDLRLSSNEVTSQLFDSIFPSAEKITSSSAVELALGEEPLHLIAILMGKQMKNHMARADKYDKETSWHLLSEDPILYRLGKLFTACIRLGSNLYGQNIEGFSPLGLFLESQRRWIRSEPGSNPIRYWARCIYAAGVDLMEYGNRERRTYQWPIRIGWRSDEIYTVRLFAIGFKSGPTILDWRLVVEQITTVQTYKRERFPGSWPEDLRLPQTICWKPTKEMLKNGEIWTWDKNIFLNSRVDRDMHASDCPGIRRLLQGTQDDNVGAARLLNTTSRMALIKQRRASEPTPIGHSQRQVDDTDSNKPWLRGYFRYCPICYERLRSGGNFCHRWDHNAGRCSVERMWEGDRLIEMLKSWKRYVKEHDRQPVQCLGHAAEKLVNPMTYHLVDAFDLFEYAGTTYWFCNEFPHCLHQKSYLDLMASNASDVG